MSRPPRSLPAQPSPAAAARALRRAARFVRRALPLCRAHTVEFFTRGLWERLVAPRPDAVLEALRAAGPLARPLAAGSDGAAAPCGEWGGGEWGGGGGAAALGPAGGTGRVRTRPAADGARPAGELHCRGSGACDGGFVSSVPSCSFGNEMRLQAVRFLHSD